MIYCRSEVIVITPCQRIPYNINRILFRSAFVFIQHWQRIPFLDKLSVRNTYSKATKFNLMWGKIMMYFCNNIVQLLRVVSISEFLFKHTYDLNHESKRTEHKRAALYYYRKKYCMCDHTMMMHHLCWMINLLNDDLTVQWEIVIWLSS